MNMIEKRKAMAGQGGFTLIELLVVIAILAVLAGAAIIGIGAMRGNAEEQVCSVDKKTIETAAEAWSLTENPTALTVDIGTGNAPAAGTLRGDGYLKDEIDGFSGATRTAVDRPFVAMDDATPPAEATC